MEKIALVTGSTNNIGKAIAEVLAGQGFHVIVTSRHGEEAKRVSENLSKKGSWFAVDFSEVSAIENLFNFVKDKFQRLDVLVNNVAYTKNESISDCDLTTWEYTINTNLRSYYLCTKLASEIMKGHGGGAIVNITVSSTRGIKDKFSYSVSKGGINSLTMSAAIDLAPFDYQGKCSRAQGLWEPRSVTGSMWTDLLRTRGSPLATSVNRRMLRKLWRSSYQIRPNILWAQCCPWTAGLTYHCNANSPLCVYLPGTRRRWVCCVALLEVLLSTPGYPLAGGAPRCRPGYPAEGWVVHTNANWHLVEKVSKHVVRCKNFFRNEHDD